MPAQITVHYLGNHPRFARQLATWSWIEWRSIYEQRGQTFADALRNYEERTKFDRLPLALIAFANEELAGTVSLKHHDLEIRPEVTPCIGGLFVIPGWRGRGVASLLMQRAVEAAAKLDLGRLFLWTSSAEGLYVKLGWRPRERLEYYGKTITIMEIEAGEPARHQVPPR